MRKALFDISLFRYDTQDWKEKKAEIISWSDKMPMYRSEANNFYSDKNPSQRINENSFYMQDFISLFEDKFSLFQDEAGLDSVSLTDVWFAEYEQGDCQLPHSHGSTGFTGTLYVNFDEEKHPSTTVIQPWSGILNDETTMINIYAEEGTLIIMPSNLLHFSGPNKYSHKKTVISFDLKCTSKYMLWHYG